MASDSGCYDYNRPVLATLDISSIEGISEAIKGRGVLRLDEIKSVCFNQINNFVKVNLMSLEFTRLLLACDQRLWSRSLSRLEEFLCDENYSSLESDEFWKYLFDASDSMWRTILFRSSNFHFSTDIMLIFKSTEFWNCMGDVNDNKWRALLVNLQTKLDITKLGFALTNNAFIRNLQSLETWGLVQRRLSVLLMFPSREEFGHWSDFWEMIGLHDDETWHTYRMALNYSLDEDDVDL
jgi:hypothetical protein